MVEMVGAAGCDDADENRSIPASGDGVNPPAQDRPAPGSEAAADEAAGPDHAGGAGSAPDGDGTDQPSTGQVPAEDAAASRAAVPAAVEAGRLRAMPARRTILRVGGAAAAAVGGIAIGAASPHRAGTLPLPAITTTPANGATGIDPSKPVTVRVSGGTITSVELAGGKQIGGTLSTDRRSWTSDSALSISTTYRLTVNAVNPLSAGTTLTTSFQTLAPTATIGIHSVVPSTGSTVGVGQPIRLTLTGSVPQEYKAALEKACVVTTTPAVKGAWYWVSNDSNGAVLDWRPENYWPTGTKVSVAFDLDGVRLGEQQYGVENYPAHTFTISDRDLRLIIDKDTYRATCYENGNVIRTFPISTGITSAETFVTYTGTMAVLGKGNPVEMKGNYGPGDTYDEFVDWATQITWSGTYVHSAPWDPDIGNANIDSHGCIHCHPADAQWFYQKVTTGDVVSITGSRARPVAVDDGICTFTLDWPTLLSGSAYGPTINGKPA